MTATGFSCAASSSRTWRAGALDGLSIGYQLVRSHIDRARGTRHLLDIDLWEISLVTFPLLPAARVTAGSGALTGVAAGGAVFSLRNNAGNGEFFVVRRLGVGFLTTTAFTTAQAIDFGAYVARSFTASDSGGTAIALTGSNQKLRTAHTAPNAADARISATGALTAGTRTLDAQPIGVVAGWAGGVGQGVISPFTANLWDQYAGDHQLVLAPNEGLIIAPLTAMGAAGVGRLYVNAELAVVASY
jgi:hypothetical protein